VLSLINSVLCMVGRVLWFRTEVDSENSSVKIVVKMQSRSSR
jgi:hypothetical protein